MPSALVVGGTGFVGRHTVAELFANGYDVTALSRDRHGYRFPERMDVTHVTGDRTDADTLAAVVDRVDPDVVVDCALYHPADARATVDVVADVDVDAYVYVSSGGTYAAREIPKREDETPLHDCTSGQARDDSMATYGPRKAECDRIVRAAADRGVAATSVRPTVVYGPQTLPAPGEPEAWDREVPASWAADWPGAQGHHDYWVDRVARYNRVVVPGDGTAIWHRAYVEDVTTAIRAVAERGTPGEAYNVADRRVCTLEDVLGLVADALDTSVEVVHASARELERAGLSPDDFPLYHHPGTTYPHVLATDKLAALGWASTPPDVAMARTAAESGASDRTGSGWDPGREAEERLLRALD